MKAKTKNTKKSIGWVYCKFFNNDFQIMYNGNYLTLGRPSVPTETKDPQIEMKLSS